MSSRNPQKTQPKAKAKHPVPAVDPAWRERVASLDAAARWPVLALLFTGLFWGVCAGGLQVLAAIKLHAPGFLAGVSWLTYGRVQPAAWNLLVFGFGIPIGLGFAAWVTSRLGESKLAWGGLLILGVEVWSVGLVLGVIGLLGGGATGVEGLELPAFSFPILVAGYLIMVLPVLRTFALRQEREVYLSMWYVLGALVSFPWFYVGAELTAVIAPLRGVLPAAIGAWFVHGVFVLWFGGLTMAAVFYFIPKLLGQPVPSRNVALFGFWMLVVGGSLGGGGRYVGGPFPAWMPSLGIVGNAWLVVPLASVAVNLGYLLRGKRELVKKSNVLGFSVFAAAACLLWFALTIVNNFGFIRFNTHFTLFTLGLDWLLLMGAFGMSMMGAAYYVVPRLLGRDWERPRWVRIHLGLAAGAVVILVGASLLGGWVHGAAMNDPALPFVDVTRRYIPFAATGTLAFLLFLLATLMLVAQVKLLLWGRYATQCLPVVRGWIEPESEEAKA